MPKTNINYANTIIYKIICNDRSIVDTYVGYTTNFVQRKHLHKQNCTNVQSIHYKCKLYDAIRSNGGWNNWQMEIIDHINCNNQAEAKQKEREYIILLNATLNSSDLSPSQMATPENEAFISDKISTGKCSYTPDPQNHAYAVPRFVATLPTLKNELTPAHNLGADMVRGREVANQVTSAKVFDIAARNMDCIFCEFECKYKCDLIRHLSTNKHLFTKTINCEMSKHTSNRYHCVCGNTYRFNSSFYKHKKKCNIYNQPPPEHLSSLRSHPGDVAVPAPIDHTIMIEILKQNTEFKDLVLEQNKTILELATKVNTTTNNVINSNNNNNFNLNVFLNETCKDAMNMNDFIKDMHITNDELENVGKLGYVSGISNIILHRIKQLDICKRPLHCTDLKRETMYIRDDNTWNKDSDDNAQLRKIIGRIAKKNLSKIPEWREQHPHCLDYDHEQYDFCIKLFRNSLGDVGDEQTRLDTKIIKYIAKMVIVDKNVQNITLNIHSDP